MSPKKDKWISRIPYIAFIGLYLLGASDVEGNSIIYGILGFALVVLLIYYVLKLVEVSNQGGRTVYISGTGKAYHRSRYCNGLNLNISMLEKEAIARGYVKCSRCK